MRRALLSLRDAYELLISRHRRSNRAFYALLLFTVGSAGVLSTLDVLWTVCGALLTGVLRWAGVVSWKIPEVSWPRLIGGVIPLLMLWGGLKWAQRLTRGGPLVRGTHLERPAPAIGLVVFLSRYTMRGALSVEAGTPTSVEALGAALNDAASGDFRRQIFASAWGPLYAAAEYHRDSLRHCWIITTGGSGGTSADVGVAERVVRLAGDGSLTCYSAGLTVQNASDVTEVVRVVDRIYRELAPAVGLEPENVVTDITGGTGMMSAGAMLATVGVRRRVQYLRQDADAALIDASEKPIRARRRDEIAGGRILVEVVTGRDVLPREEPGHPGSGTIDFTGPGR